MLLTKFTEAIKCAQIVTVGGMQANFFFFEKNPYIKICWFDFESKKSFHGYINQKSLDLGKRAKENSYYLFLFSFDSEKNPVFYKTGITIRFWNLLEMPI